MDVFVHPRAKSLLEPFQGSLDPLRNRFAPQTKAAVPRLPAVVRESEEIEGLRSTFPPCSAIHHRESAELDEARLVGVQIKRELAQALLEVAEKLFRILLALATNDEVSRPGESHPRALAELYVNVSAHTAPIIQPPASTPADASGRTAGARDALTASRGSTAPPARAVDRRDTLDDATPLLHRVSPTSSLVRVAPPLCLASGFSSLGVGPLDFSLHIEATGSHVPHKGLVQGHATFMPGAAQPSCRLPLDLSRVNDSPRFRHRPYAFDTLPVVHTLRLPAPYLTRSSRAVSVTLTTSALDRGSARRFEASPCRAAPRGLPSSLVQHGCS